MVVSNVQGLICLVISLFVRCAVCLTESVTSSSITFSNDLTSYTGDFLNIDGFSTFCYSDNKNIVVSNSYYCAI